MRPSDASVLTTVAAASTRERVHTDISAYNNGTWGVYPSTHFNSINDQAPALLVNTWNRAAIAQNKATHIFIQHDTPLPKSKRAGGREQGSSPLIIDADDLSTVYLNRSFPGVANVNVQEYDGAPLLTFYGGKLDSEGGQVGNGWIWAYDENYEEVGRLQAQNLKVLADAHEFIMTGPKTAVVTAYETIDWDLSAYSDDENAAHATVLDCLFQEINLDTLEVLFEWRASDHIPMDMSFEQTDEEMFPPKSGWDYFHLTSVQKSSQGHYLVSGANTHSLYEIDGTTGEVHWTLGGKGNEFEELAAPEGRNFSAPLLTMAWQHHARFYPGKENELTVFDNHGTSINGWGCTSDCSRGLHLTLDTAAKKAQLLNEFLHPIGLWSTSEGSVQVLPDGNVFIGWGRNPAVTEHTADGAVVLDVQFSPWRSPATDWQSLDSYRAFKAEWAGAPTGWDPAIAAQSTQEGDVTAWVSWNGATDVRGWVLLASNKPNDLDGPGKVVARAERGGFETMLWAPGVGARYLRAAALGEHGLVLGASGVWDTRHKKVAQVAYPVTEVVKHETPAEAALHGSEYAKSGSGGEEGGGRKASLPHASYHEVMTVEWSWGATGLRIAGVVLGVWAFSRFF